MKHQDWANTDNYTVEHSKRVGYISVSGKGAYSSYFYSRARDPRAYPSPQDEAADMWAQLLGDDD